MDLLLIRHGQSEANAKGLLISTDKDGLTELGKTQSVKLAATLERFAFQPSKIYCSPWARARQTAELLFSPAQPMTFDARLAETHPGIYGSWLEADFNRAFPDFNLNMRNRYENGESHLDMAERVQAWVEDAVKPEAHNPGLIAAVAHGGPISVVLQYLLGVPIETHYPSFTVPNASFTYLKWRADLNRYCLERAGHV
ncbi:histidine phosphatase family protein [Paraburkholderia sprentiae WSM5005]|uniref:Histidine phosphatase family protein n=1 Tax=Paraburkholderia sprentiae WSM5005 TaxID=754502 RepID=A0A1I9YH45_9BURK|nr:histidine phosphatase family protein [Paraburkholderia sprentiae]APA85628.1 histidine phosphatase family protein [Paraburkholderia sprentiae WSM5005]